MGIAERVVYRFLRLAQQEEEEFTELRTAFDRACEHLEAESAAPLEIVQGEDVLLDAFDLYGLCECYYDWKDGQAQHPLTGAELSHG